MRTPLAVRLCLFSLFSFAICFAQSAAPASGVDLSAIDKSVNPCQNFYQYACSNWRKKIRFRPNIPDGAGSTNC